MGWCESTGSRFSFVIAAHSAMTDQARNLSTSLAAKFVSGSYAILSFRIPLSLRNAAIVRVYYPCS